jgi:trigger factor
MRAEDFAQQVVSSGQLGALMSEVLRGKALALALEHAKIRDTAGNDIDLDALTEQFAPPAAPAGDDAGDDGEPADSAESAEVAETEGAPVL